MVRLIRWIAGLPLIAVGFVCIFIALGCKWLLDKVDPDASRSVEKAFDDAADEVGYGVENVV